MEASDPQRMDSRDPKAGLSRPPLLWSVSGGQAGCEEEVMTEHLPRLGPVRGPGQVWPHEGPLGAFCTDSGLVCSYPAGPHRGGSRPCQGKGGTTREPRGDHPPHNWEDLAESTPPTVIEGRSLCRSLPPRCPSISLTGLQEPGGEGGGLRPESPGQRAEEVQAVPGVKVSWFPCVCTRDSPPQNRGDPKSP